MSKIKPMRIVGWLGKLLLAAGVLLLAFVAFQLWGTGLHEAKAQEDLNKQFTDLLANQGTTTTPPTTAAGSGGPTTTTPAKPVKAVQLATEVGQPIGRMQIPKLHVDKIIVQGVPLEELDRAPGHYPQTPFPGQAGNASIAGHRTTYGAPFFNIDKLRPGDEIFITTLQGKFRYKMIWSKIVQPEAMWVLDTDPDHPNTLTLTACHPRLDLTQRYIVRAVLEGKPAPTSPAQSTSMKKYAASTSGLADGVTKASHPEAWPRMLMWAAACAAIWLAAWWTSRRWRGREHHGAHARQSRRIMATVVPYVIGVPLFAVALFFAFENLSNIVPAGL